MALFVINNYAKFSCVLFAVLNFFVPDTYSSACVRAFAYSYVYVHVRFSAEGTPYMVDSEGIVRMMSSGFNNTWVEVANLRHHVSCFDIFVSRTLTCLFRVFLQCTYVTFS